MQKLSNGGFNSASVEVVYNGDALKQSFVESTVESKLALADAALARQINKVASGYIKVITVGGEINALGQNFKLLGLVESKKLLDDDARGRAAADRAQARAAAGVREHRRREHRPLQRRAQHRRGPGRGRRRRCSAAAARRWTRSPSRSPSTVSLMFVCVLLASGLLALEREENTFSRLARGLVPGGRLLAGKVVLAAGCASVVTLVMLLGISAFVPLDYARVALWIVAIAVSGIAFATLGVAIGSLAREVRAASLLALMLALPLAFLALVPERRRLARALRRHPGDLGDRSRSSPRSTRSTTRSTTRRRASWSRSRTSPGSRSLFGAAARWGLRRFAAA